MTPGSLAKRYARALAALAREENLFEKTGDEIEGLLKALQAMPGALEALSSTTYSRSDRQKAWEKIADRFQISKICRNFVGLLIQKERIAHFSSIVSEYLHLRDLSLSIVRAELTGVRLPSKKLTGILEKELAHRLKKTVTITGREKPEILGGLVLKVGETIFDGSVKRNLERLKESLQS